MENAHSGHISPPPLIGYCVNYLLHCTRCEECDSSEKTKVTVDLLDLC